METRKGPGGLGVLPVAQRLLICDSATTNVRVVAYRSVRKTTHVFNGYLSSSHNRDFAYGVARGAWINGYKLVSRVGPIGC